MPWFVYRIYPVPQKLITEGANEQEKPILAKHFQYLKELTEKEVVLLAGADTRNAPGGLAIVIFKADTGDAASQIMNNDPAFKGGVFRGDVLPFHVSLLNAKSFSP